MKAPRIRSSPVLVLLPCLLVVLAAGCARDDDRSKETGPGVGDTIVVPYISDLTSINELTGQSATLSTGILYYGLFAPLAAEEANYEQGPPTFQPQLATSWQFSDDRKQLTFTLRDDVQWSDGEPLTADDVRFTWQAQVHPDIAWSWVDYKRRISDVEVVDPTTVVFHFSEVYAGQLHDVVQGVILPEHKWSQLPFEEWNENSQWFVDNLVVSGPYDLESWQPGQRLVLTRNERYYGGPELPKTDRIVFEIIPDRHNQFSMLRSGEGHFVELILPEDTQAVIDDPDLYLLTYMPRYYAFIVWNTENPLFEDAAVRRALTLAIDRQNIIDTVYYGYAEPSHSAIPPNVWAHHDGLEPLPYDPDAARAALAEAGWTDSDGDGILDKDGSPFRFELVTNTGAPVRQDIIVIVQQQLKRVGIDAQPVTMEFNALLAPLSNQEFDAAMSVLGLSTDLDLSYYFHTRGIESGYNWGAFSDAEVDALIDEIAAEMNPGENLDRFRELQELIHEQQPVTFLYHALRLSAARTSLRDVDPNVLSPFHNLPRWRLVDPDEEPLPPELRAAPGRAAH